MKFYNHSLSNLKNIIKKFSKNNLNKIAIQTGFTKRNSKLDGSTFLKAFTFGVYSLEDVSLRNIASFCEDISDGLSLSRQAIKNKLHVGADFIKQVFQYVFSDKLFSFIYHNHINIFKTFDDVIIADSTVFQLHESLKNIFKGYGGNNSQAGIKIQAIYSFKHKQFNEFQLQDEVFNDKSYTKNIIDNLSSNQLLLVDLGYFNKSDFKALQDKKGYFLSKVKSNTVFYFADENNNKKMKKLDLIQFLKKSNGKIDTHLFVGAKKDSRIECRVVGMKLSDEATNVRIMRAAKKARDQGKTLKKIDRELMSWIIMITNVEKEKATLEMLLDIYRVRWQIEILFKCWKSYAKIDNVENIGEDYLYCLLYGRLIMIILINSLYSELCYFYKEKYAKEISILMLYSSVGNYLKDICRNMINKPSNISTIYSILMGLVNKCYREKRNRKTTEGILTSYYLPPVI